MAVNSNCDPLQPFFHFENELQDVLPSKDFWKKFELLSSPPPNRAYDQSIISDTHSSQPFLKPIIFQDCMWSGFNVDAELEEANATWMESAGSRAFNMDYLQDLNMSLLQWIDPALIFPYLVEESKHSAPPRQHSHCRGKFMVILYKLGHYWVYSLSCWQMSTLGFPCCKINWRPRLLGQWNHVEDWILSQSA